MIRLGAGRRGMLMGRSDSSNRRPENVIPMINIVFLLLLYFMVAGNLYVDVNVTPPVSDANTPPPKHVPQISVTNTGALLFNGDEITVEEIEGSLKERFQGQTVQISGDARADTIVVARILRALSKAGAARVVLLSLQRQ